MSTKGPGEEGEGGRRRPREVDQLTSHHGISWRSQPRQVYQTSSDHWNSWRSQRRQVDQPTSNHQLSRRSQPRQVDQRPRADGVSWRKQPRQVDQKPSVWTPASDNQGSSECQRERELLNSERKFSTEAAVFPIKVPSRLFIISNVVRGCSRTAAVTTPRGQEAVEVTCTVPSGEGRGSGGASGRTGAILDSCPEGVPSSAASEVTHLPCPLPTLTSDTLLRDFWPRPIVMYLNFPKLTRGNVNIFGYIPSQFPAGAELTVTEEEQHNTLSMLTVDICQDTKQVTTKPHFDNDSSKVKIWCFDTSQDAEEQGLSTEHILMVLGGHVQNVLESHFNKISNVQRELELARQQEKESPRDGSALPNSIIQDLVDKERQLVLQKQEFLLYMKKMFDELVEPQRPSNFKWPENELNLVFTLECNRLFDASPVYTRRSDILNTVKTNQVTVIVGEPGCGKSSQIPQYLHHAGFLNSGSILCTQPCRIGAKMLASYVTGEMLSGGQFVNHLHDKATYVIPETKIEYVTNNTLLRKCLKNENLTEVSCIVLEAHERSLKLDILLGLIKRCLQKRSDLRLVITCNALNPAPFVEYFQQCPVLEVTGRKFPVTVEWKDTGPFGNFVNEAAKTAVKVHQSEEEGDIIVILYSPSSASSCYESCINLMGYKTKDYVALLLHENLEDHRKQCVFNPIPYFNAIPKRKIIFSSDCAEIFVTIPKVRYVIDAGYTQVRVFTREAQWKRKYTVRDISQCSAKQRLGVVGRVSSGTCYRLYTPAHHMKMDDNAPPEIKSIDPCMLVYKLLDLGIDPRKFDFITKPDVQDWNEVYSKLTRDGIIVGNQITDIGRWIVELSLKPETCELVYEGVREGVGLEAIVLAELYWREVFVSEKRDKKLAAARKLALCHDGSDHLTELNVFTQWLEVPDDNKHTWCSYYFVQQRSLTDANAAVCEMLRRIKKVFKIDIKFVFRKLAAEDWLLKSLLFKLLRGRLSYYLGHPAGGYYIISDGGRVHIEQTSALHLLGVQPEWVVSNVVNTYPCTSVAKYTHVPSYLIGQELRNGCLSLDMEELQNNRVAVVCRVGVGDQLACKFFSSKYLETFKLFLLEKFPESEVFVFYEKEKKELQLVALKDNESDLHGAALAALAPLKAKFLQEKCLERFGQKLRGLRALIGAGGSVSNILTSEESKTVMIHVPEHNTEMYTESILKLFEENGEIEDYQKYIQTENSSLWGHITYEKIGAALRAVEDLEADLESNYGLVVQPNGANNLAIKIQWHRNFSLKLGYIRFSDEKYHLEAVEECNSRGWLGGAQLAISEDKNSLRILHLDKEVTEYSLQSDIAAALNIDPRDILEVRIPELKVKQWKMQKQLSNKIGDLIKFDAVSLYLKEPCEGDVNFTAYYVLKNTDDVHIAYKHLCKFLRLEKKVGGEASPDSSLYIQEKVFQINYNKLLELVNEMEENGMSVALKHLRNGDVMMYLSCEDARVLVTGKLKVEKVVAGEVIDLKCEGGAKVLFKQEGKAVLDAIMYTTATLIVTDDRITTLSIHGPTEARQSAKDKIYKFLQLSVESLKYIELTGGGKPPGVMKTLMETYGSTLGGLRAETGLSALKLDYRNHRLYLFGSRKCVRKAAHVVNKVMQTLIGDGSALNKDDPLCVICLFPINTSNTLYRLEYCGHAYCQRCIRLHITQAVNNKKFPLVCFVKECDEMFTCRDLTNLNCCLEKRAVTRASVSAFVDGNKGLHYCVTPLCQSVYRAAPKNSAPFTCPECSTKICISCHTNFHDGFTCKEYRRLLKVSASGEDSDN
ncbi:uncharacterized protein [Procambarus clarkii]|uniref:uncharacterized protein n=1 Tax=Procambarus clarkii TaxID=6728 RepID=UPI0037446B30